MKKSDFLSLSDFSASELLNVLMLAQTLKKEQKENIDHSEILRGKVLTMLFEKPSLRTKLSFEIGMKQFGGHAVYFGQSEIGLGKRESVADIAKVISSMSDVLMARIFDHAVLEELAAHAQIPVINGLSDLEHPCQILADLLTIIEQKGTLEGLAISYVGDGNNNIVHSFLLASVLLKFHFRVASPPGYRVNRSLVEKAKRIDSSFAFVETSDPRTVVSNADVVVTDTWVSMGKELEREKRLAVFFPYQVNDDLMGLAKKDAIFLHCLPAHRGEEVTADVIDGPQSYVFEEAENRLHVQKAMLSYLLLR